MTVDTTDGEFLVSGGNNDGLANKFRVEVPTHLDKTLIDTTDGNFVVSGENKMYINTVDSQGVGLDVDTHAVFDQVTIDTTDGNFAVQGSGGMTMSPTEGIDFDSHTRFGQISVDTKNTRMYIRDTSQVTLNSEPAFDLGHLPSDLIDNQTGELQGVVSIDCHTLLDQVTVNTFDGPLTIYSNAAVVHANKEPLDVRVPTKLLKTTIDTSQADGQFEVTGSNRAIISATEGDVNNVGFEVINHALLNQTTIDTKTGEFKIESTAAGDYADYEPLNVQVPTLLGQTTIDINDGGVLIKDTVPQRGNQVEIQTPTLINNNVTFDLGSRNSKVSLTGVGGEVLFDTTSIYFDSRVDFRETDVEFKLGQGDIVSFRGANEVNNADVGLVQSFVPIDTLNTTLSSSNVVFQPSDGDKVVVRGDGEVDVSINSTFRQATLTVNSQPVFDLHVGDFTVSDPINSQFDLKHNMVVNVPTIIHGLSAYTTQADVGIGGSGLFVVDSESEFNSLATFTNEIRSTSILNSTGLTRLSETYVNLDQGEVFEVGNTDDSQPGFMRVQVEAEYTENVVFRKDITVDGNVYLHADSQGVIHLGDDPDDSVSFKADVGSDVLPDVESGRIVSTHSLGSTTSIWNELHVNTSFMDRIEVNEAVVDDKLTVNGSILFDVDQNDFVITGEGYTKMYNDTIMTGTFSAAEGPWYFGGEDPEQDPAVQ